MKPRFKVGDGVKVSLPSTKGFMEAVVRKKSKYKKHGNTYFEVELERGRIVRVCSLNMKPSIKGAYKEKLKEIIK